MSQYSTLVEAFNTYAGKYVEDKLSGFRGYVTQVTQRFSGNIVLSVFPKSVDTVKDGADIDFQQCSIVDCEENPHHDDLKTAPLPESLLIPIGAKVVDIITDAKMTITSATIFLNGCVYHNGTTKQREDGKVGAEFLPYQRYKQLADAPIPVPKPSVQTAPGGPTTKSQRAS